MEKIERYCIEAKNCGTRHYFRIPGIDFGSDLQIYNEGQRYILAQVKGCMGWAGRGMMVYRNPKLIIFDKQDDSQYFYTGVIQKEYTRQTRKETIKEMTEIFDRLEREHIEQQEEKILGKKVE